MLERMHIDDSSGTYIYRMRKSLYLDAKNGVFPFFSEGGEGCVFFGKMR